ncbi:MAG TPA: LamG domain-containing protein [Candidatus Nanoarchaeia archaeon]|nr:LamG domain-containing protein [Candidatus Nanoarchaeia archaeon]
MKKRRNKTPEFSNLKFLHNYNFALFIMFLMLLSISLVNVNLTGLTVYLQEEVVDDYPNLDLTSNYTYSSFINEKNFDHLSSVKVSGGVSNNGIVKIRIGGVLIFDSSKLLEEDKITGLIISNETFGESNSSLENNTGTVVNVTLNESSNTDDYIVFDDYCLDSCNMFFNDTSINLSFEVLNSNIKIDKISYVIVNKDEELGPTSIVNESTTSDEIIVEKDIKWTKTIELKEYGVVNTTLPSESKNIDVNKVVNEDEFDVDKDKIKIENPNLLSKDKPVTVTIEDQALKFEINYETPGPDKIESALVKEEYKLVKNVSVSSDLHLENITSYVDVPNVNKEQIKILWLDNDSNSWIDVTSNPNYELEYSDINKDGKFERVYWNVPHLSNETFSVQIDLLILNVHSNPLVGGRWTVAFNTTGSANLTIEPIQGTKWSNNDDSGDLRFLELKCEENLINYEWIDNKIYVDNYTCNGQTSFEASRVITYGSHHLRFTFGNLIADAHNLAYIPNSGLLVYSNNNETCATRTYFNQTWSQPSSCLPIDSGYVPRVLNLYSSKTRNETIMLMKAFLTVSIQDAVYAHIWNGTAWSNITVFSKTIPRNWPISDRFYDGCYLNNGDFMALYSDGADVTTNLWSKVWNGTVWTDNYSIATFNGGPEWVDLKCRPDGNEAMALVLVEDINTGDNNITSIFFNFSSGYTANSWGFQTIHASDAPDDRFEEMDLAWSNNDTSRGILMYVDSSDGTAKGKAWNSTNGNLTFGNAFATPDFGSHVIGDVVIRAHPNNETYNNSYLAGFTQAVVTVNNPVFLKGLFVHNLTPNYTLLMSSPFENITNFSDGGVQVDFDIAWEKTGRDALYVYHLRNNTNGGAIYYRLYNATNGSLGKELYGGASNGGINEVLILKPDLKSSDDMMLVELDTAQSIGTKWWNGTSNSFSSIVTHGAAIGPPSDTDLWADFAWSSFENATAVNKAPNWSTPGKNQTTIFNGQFVNFSTIWSDDTGLSTFILEINQSGNYVNSSPTLFNPTGGTLRNSTNVTKIIGGAGFNVTWRFYANDTNDNWNVTALQSFVISGLVPNSTLSIPANYSRDVDSNLFFQCNVTDDQEVINVTLYTNSSKTCSGTAAECSLFFQTEELCEAQLGCTYDLLFGSCSGAATSCNVVNATYCQSQQGCTLFSPNKTIDVREIDERAYPKDLVLLYHFNNETNSTEENATQVKDFSGNNNTGYITEAISNLSGKFGGAYTFRGPGIATDFINASDSVSLDVTENVTVMTWVNIRSTNIGGIVAAKFDSASGCQSPFTVYSLEVQIGQDAVFRVTSDGTRTTAESTGNDLPLGWHHLVGMYNGTNITVWVDGTLRAITVHDLGNFLIIDNSDGQLAIGRNVLCDNLQLNATVDELAIFNRSFTPQEIYQFYNVSKKDYQANYTINNIASGTYGWNCLVNDVDSNRSFQQFNWTFSVNNKPNVTLSYVANNSVIISNNLSLQCNITDDIAIANVTLYHNLNGTFIANETRDYGEVDPIDNSYSLVLHLNNDSTFGENATWVRDFSGRDNNGTVFKGSRFNSSGYFNGGYQFFSNESHINISASQSLNLTGQNFTIAAWFLPLGPQADSANIVSKCANNCDTAQATFYSYLIGYYTTTKLRGAVRATSIMSGPSTLFYYLTTPFTLPTGVWIHAVFTVEGQTLSLYINGTLVNSTGMLQGPDEVPDVDFDDPVRIGAFNPPKNNASFNGTIDEVVILNRSMNDEEIFQLYNRSISQISSYENFTFTNIVNLSGVYNWSCLAYDNESQFDWADANWTFKFNTSVAPSITTGPTITPTTPTTLYDLNCSFVITDQDSFETITANVTWLRNSSILFNFSFTVTNGRSGSSVLHNFNTTRYDDWNCTVQPFDGRLTGTNKSARTVIINAIPDNVTLGELANGTTVHDRILSFNWTNVTDYDNDSVRYMFLVDDNINFASPEVNKTTFSNSTTLGNPLALAGGANTRYYWKVISLDGVNGTGNSTETRTFLIESIVQLTLPTSKVNFGTMINDQSDNTTDDSPAPLTVENDGNTIINVSLTQDVGNLWLTSPSPTAYFMFKISNKTGEEGAFNWSGSHTNTFSNVPIANNISIHLLNWTNATDIAEVDLNVTVPTNEGGGNRTASVLFTATLAE